MGVPSTLDTAVAVLGPDGKSTWRCCYWTLDRRTDGYVQCATPVNGFQQRCPGCWRIAPQPPADLYTRTVHVQAPVAPPVQVQATASRGRAQSDMSILVQEFQQAEVSSGSRGTRSSSRSRSLAPAFKIDRRRCAAPNASGDHKNERCPLTSDSVHECGFCGNHRKAYGF